MCFILSMSKKSDKSKQVRIADKIYSRLLAIQRRQSVKMSMVTLANTAMFLGIKSLEKSSD